MPGMAARLGDPTAHGGVIVLGFPMVLIGGMPAARVGDMHVCPMITPGLPPIPHVGMPIVSPGAPTVLIGGMPAATVGSIAPCVGPPDSVMMGCPTVMLGAGGAGSAGGGGGGGGGGAAAQASAATAQFDNNESVTKEEHWIEFEFVDKAGLPVSGIPYKFTDVNGKTSEGVLRLDGTVRREGLAEGQCKVVLMGVSNARWSKNQAKVGDKVRLSAEVEGFESGSPALIQIYKRDITGADTVMTQIDAKTQGSKVETTWLFQVATEEGQVLVPKEGSIGGQDQTKPYSSPEYYFDVILERCQARSDHLYLEDYIELSVMDEDGNAVADEDYVLYVSDGAVRKGTLDGSGFAREEKIPAGHCDVRFPKLPERRAKK